MIAQRRRGAILNPQELAQLTDAWQIWSESAPTQARAVTRARLHLFFLLARFGGLRPGEIAATEPAKICDLAGGALNLSGRRMFLPAGALRALRRILTLPESSSPDFLHLDSGFVRRTFYALAELCGLPPASCAPMALRYARAHEMLAMNIPAHLVAKTLGFRNPLQLPVQNPRPRGKNSFPAMLTGLELSSSSARLSLKLYGSLLLQAITSLEELLGLEPAVGQMIDIQIEPGSIRQAREETGPNRLEVRILSMDRDEFEIRLRLRAGAGLELNAVLDRQSLGDPVFKPETKIAVIIPAHAIRLRLPNSAT